MKTLIFRTVAPWLAGLMLLFSVFVLLRGHNEPGGGFIGGLIAASAFALHGIACGVASTRRALVVHPMSLAGTGLLLAALSGLPAIVLNSPFMTSIWIAPGGIDLATVMAFDTGVYLVVTGAITSIALALEEREG